MPLIVPVNRFHIGVTHSENPAPFRGLTTASNLPHRPAQPRQPCPASTVRCLVNGIRQCMNDIRAECARPQSNKCIQNMFQIGDVCAFSRTVHNGRLVPDLFTPQFLCQNLDQLTPDMIEKGNAYALAIGLVKIWAGEYDAELSDRLKHYEQAPLDTRYGVMDIPGMRDGLTKALRAMLCTSDRVVVENLLCYPDLSASAVTLSSVEAMFLNRCDRTSRFGGVSDYPFTSAHGEPLDAIFRQEMTQSPPRNRVDEPRSVSPEANPDQASRSSTDSTAVRAAAMPSSLEDALAELSQEQCTDDELVAGIIASWLEANPEPASRPANLSTVQAASTAVRMDPMPLSLQEALAELGPEQGTDDELVAGIRASWLEAHPEFVSGPAEPVVVQLDSTAVHAEAMPSSLEAALAELSPEQRTDDELVAGVIASWLEAYPDPASTHPADSVSDQTDAELSALEESLAELNRLYRSQIGEIRSAMEDASTRPVDSVPDQVDAERWLHPSRLEEVLDNLSRDRRAIQTRLDALDARPEPAPANIHPVESAADGWPTVPGRPRSRLELTANRLMGERQTHRDRIAEIRGTLGLPRTEQLNDRDRLRAALGLTRTWSVQLEPTEMSVIRDLWQSEVNESIGQYPHIYFIAEAMKDMGEPDVAIDHAVRDLLIRWPAKMRIEEQPVFFNMLSRIRSRLMATVSPASVAAVLKTIVNCPEVCDEWIKLAEDADGHCHDRVLYFFRDIQGRALVADALHRGESHAEVFALCSAIVRAEWLSGATIAAMTEKKWGQVESIETALLTRERYGRIFDLPLELCVGKAAYSRMHSYCFSQIQPEIDSLMKQFTEDPESLVTGLCDLPVWRVMLEKRLQGGDVDSLQTFFAGVMDDFTELLGLPDLRPDSRELRLSGGKVLSCVAETRQDESGRVIHGLLLSMPDGSSEFLSTANDHTYQIALETLCCRREALLNEQYQEETRKLVKEHWNEACRWKGKPNGAEWYAKMKRPNVAVQ